MIVRVGNQNILISLKVITLMILVFGLGMVVKLDLWTPPDPASFKKNLPAPKRLMAHSADKRAPSSISSQALHDVSATQKTWTAVGEEVAAETLLVTTMDWDCNVKNQVIHLNKVEQLRLNGKCLKGLKAIVNNSNGYTANIFQLKDTATTDYLSLNSGSNQLQLEWLDGATGNLPKVLEIIVEKQ